MVIKNPRFKPGVFVNQVDNGVHFSYTTYVPLLAGVIHNARDTSGIFIFLRWPPVGVAPLSWALTTVFLSSILSMCKRWPEYAREGPLAFSFSKVIKNPRFKPGVFVNQVDNGVHFSYTIYVPLLAGVIHNARVTSGIFIFLRWPPVGVAPLSWALTTSSFVSILFIGTPRK